MASNKKNIQKTPEERQRIYDATTKEERLRVVKERTDPNTSSTRKSLPIGFAFDKESTLYKLIEKMTFYFGYPSGSELNEETNRVEFKTTKEDGMIQWRANESIPAEINDVLKALLTAIITSEDASLQAQARQAVMTSKHRTPGVNAKVNDFFKYLDEYRNATSDVREEKKMANAEAALDSLTPEQIQELLAKRELASATQETPMTA